MANEHDERRDEPKRRGGVVGGAPAVADEDEGLAFAGMVGIGVVSAIIVSMLWLSGFFNGQDDDAAVAMTTTAAEDDHAEEDAESEEETEEIEEAAAVEETTTTTEAATTTTEAETTTTAAEVEGAAATIDASQSGIVLSGTVPSEEAAERLRAAAVAAGYQAEQITDELEVVDGAEPFTLTVTGSTTDGVLFGRLSDEITDMENNLAGVEVDNGFTLEESSDTEAALNALEPVQFESGTAVITADTEPFLDEAATILADLDPDARVEVGGHTDSRGSDTSNQALSEARAQAVVAALVERGVGEDRLVAVGYGESRLLIDPDDTPEDQQQNRRIEYRILAG